MRARAAELLPLLIAFAPLLLGVADQIQEVDPAQYAEVGRRAFESGDWIHLRDNFGPFLNKPPLTFWLMCGAFKLFGVTSFAVRFPTLLLGALLLLLTARIGELVHDRRTGVWGAAMLGASPAFQLMVADPKVDMPVTFFMAAAIWLMLEARRRPALAYLAWVACGLAMLAKGPLGLVVPVLAVAPEGLRRPGTLWQRLRPFKPIAGPLLFLLVAGPWFSENAREFGAAGPTLMLWNQGLGRLFNPDFLKNDTTPAFFLHTALWAYLPFSPLFAVELFRRARAFLRDRRLPPDESRVLLWWFLVPFVAVSFARYRLPQYCYWMAPPAALISARALLSAALPARAMEVTQAVLSSLVVALVAFLLFLCFPGSHFLVTESWLVLTAVVAASGRWLARRVPAEVRPMAVGLFALTAFNVVFQGHLHRAILEYQPDEALGTLARQLDPSGRSLPRLGTVESQALAFYARRDAVTMTADELRAAALAGKAPYAVVAEERIPELTASGELAATPKLVRPQFWTSRPTLPFLLRRSRANVTANVALVELRPAAATPTPR